MAKNNYKQNEDSLKNEGSLKSSKKDYVEQLVEKSPVKMPAVENKKLSKVPVYEIDAKGNVSPRAPVQQPTKFSTEVSPEIPTQQSTKFTTELSPEVSTQQSTQSENTGFVFTTDRKEISIVPSKKPYGRNYPYITVGRDGIPRRVYHQILPPEANVKRLEPADPQRPSIENPYYLTQLELKKNPENQVVIVVEDETLTSDGVLTLRGTLVERKVETPVVVIVEDQTTRVETQYLISVPTSIPRKLELLTHQKLPNLSFLFFLSITSLGYLVRNLSKNFLAREKLDDRKTKKSSSFFIQAFLSRSKVELDKELIATRNLKGTGLEVFDQEVKKGMAAEVVVIIDETQGCVILEIFAEEFHGFNQKKNYVSPFIEMSRTGKIRRKIKNVFWSLYDLLKKEKTQNVFWTLYDLSKNYEKNFY